MREEDPLHCCFINSSPQLLMQACHALAGNAARHNVVEIAEVGVHVKRQAMHGHPPAATHPHCADLSRACRSFIEPHTGFTAASPCGNAVFRQRENDRFLKQPEVLVDVGEEIIEIEDRVGYQLSRTMIGYVAPAVDPEK